MRIRLTDDQVRQSFGEAAVSVPRARQAMLRILAIQTEREAVRLSSGGGAPGAYPIPVRSGFFRRGFGFELQDRKAIIFNAADTYARALHDGFRPYGNPAAMPIQPRPYFDDALLSIDIEAAAAEWEQQING